MPEITRSNQITGTWWCPLCDHSMPRNMDECAKCGAVRDGDTVSEPKRRPGRPPKVKPDEQEAPDVA